MRRGDTGDSRVWFMNGLDRPWSTTAVGDWYGCGDSKVLSYCVALFDLPVLCAFIASSMTSYCVEASDIITRRGDVAVLFSKVISQLSTSEIVIKDTSSFDIAAIKASFNQSLKSSAQV